MQVVLSLDILVLRTQCHAVFLLEIAQVTSSHHFVINYYAVDLHPLQQHACFCQCCFGHILFLPLGSPSLLVLSYANPIVPINDWARRCNAITYGGPFRFHPSIFPLPTSIFRLTGSGKFLTSGLSFSCFLLPASIEAESTKWKIGSRNGSRKMEVRNWKLEMGKWKNGTEVATVITAF